MDELFPNTNNTKEIECAKTMRSFLNTYYQSLSDIIVFRAFDNKLYVVTIQAVTVPTANTIDATPSTKIKDDFT